MPEVLGITCIDENTSAIGYNNDLIYNCPADLKYFRKITSAVPDPEKYYNILIVGAKTFQGLPSSFSLATRRLFVMAKNANYEEYTNSKKEQIVITDAIEKYDTIEKVLENYVDEKRCFRIFLIGGNSIYEKYSKYVSKFIVCAISQSEKTISYNATFKIPDSFCKFANLELLTTTAEIVKNGQKINVNYKIELYIPHNLHPEYHYISLMKTILANGNHRNAERTGAGAIGLFGQQISIDLSTGYCPLLISRKMTKNAIVHEFQWYLSGSTDVNDLRKISGKNKTVWDSNTSREFLDTQGLVDYPEGDIGPSYGHQYRHWGAKYINKFESYNAKGIDQVAALIKSLCTDPQGRRHIISLWNVEDIPRMALPPCLRDFQFYLRDGVNLLGEKVSFLDVKADQRSSDYFLAGFWNVHQVAYFIYYIIAHMEHYIKNHEQMCPLLVGKKINPGNIVMNYGDVHIYNNHIDQCKKMIDVYTREIYNNKNFVSPQVAGFSEEYGFELMQSYVPITNLTGVIN